MSAILGKKTRSISRWRVTPAMVGLPDTVDGHSVSVRAIYTRCGSPGCHCGGIGAPKHGPYLVASWREDDGYRSVVRTRYVGKA
jgi:hypothetical protein